MLLPIPISLYYEDGSHFALLISALITMGAGFASYKFTSFKQDVRAKEGFAIVTFGWIAASFFGSLPFMLSGAIPSFTDAFYETMSGFTTTGATIMTDIEATPEAILLWRSTSHWLGGMGIILLSLAILPFLGVGGMQLFKAEVPGHVADKLTPRVAQTAKVLWGVYLLFTVAEMLLLMYGGMNWFDALNHSFATLSTGGYSTRNASVGAYESSFIHYIITLFMFLAGANFALHYRFLVGDFKAYFQNTEFKIYCAIVLGASVLIGIDVYGRYGDLGQSMRDTLFQVTAITTSTGFGTADFEQWSVGSQCILLALMFIGGSAGSTAGGMKIARIYLLFRFMAAETVRLIHTNAIVPVRMGGTTVPREVLTTLIGYFVLYMMTYGIGVLLFAFLGLDLITALSATVAALSNIGPGLGSVGPTENYAHFPMLGKWLLSLLMLMGRLELFTVVVLFSPAYWRK
ncbi:MAG: TrkH family potassium uptake protein [Chloroflexota bacterium]